MWYIAVVVFILAAHLLHTRKWYLACLDNFEMGSYIKGL